MDVIIIGGGIAGIATAYQLHAAGHRVCVVERHATVAQGATYGQGGALLSSPLDVWFGPTFMASSRAKQCGMVVKTGFDSAARDFVKQLGTLRDAEAFAVQYERLQPLVELSRCVLGEIESGLELDFEQRRGMLHVFRQPREMEEAQPAIELLKRFKVPYQALTPEECVAGAFGARRPRIRRRRAVARGTHRELPAFYQAAEAGAGIRGRAGLLK